MYFVIHPLQTKDDAYSSPLLSTLVKTGILLGSSEKVTILSKAFLRRQTRIILIRALEQNNVLQSMVGRILRADADETSVCTDVDVCLVKQVILYRPMFS